MNTYSFTLHFKKISACSKVLIEKKPYMQKHACHCIVPILSVNSVALNNNSSEQCFLNLLVALLHCVKNLVSLLAQKYKLYLLSSSLTPLASFSFWWEILVGFKHYLIEVNKKS